MASKMCDVEPCDRLIRSRQFFVRDPNYDPEKGILIATLQKKKGQVNGYGQDINFKYCPFCGTRLSQGLVEVLQGEERHVRRYGT